MQGGRIIKAGIRALHLMISLSEQKHAGLIGGAAGPVDRSKAEGCDKQGSIPRGPGGISAEDRA